MFKAYVELCNTDESRYLRLFVIGTFVVTADMGVAMTLASL